MLHYLINLSRLQKQAIAASMDSICLPVTFILAIWLRYEGFNEELFRHYFGLIVSIPLISVPIFIRIGLYRAVVRFIDQKLLVRYLLVPAPQYYCWHLLASCCTSCQFPGQFLAFIGLVP